ncbi:MULTISPECIES: hypothetical protein [unclassified Wolbachia]|uniref:hypothetical protein n=1 Tax=unclassified Wolbachia TaxID=2640676 RepID=UPI00223225F4|nr:hypothetical protein [Wolbachia endosymbiont (group A) of Apoderus coryli]
MQVADTEMTRERGYWDDRRGCWDDRRRGYLDDRRMGRQERRPFPDGLKSQLSAVTKNAKNNCLLI